MDTEKDTGGVPTQTSFQLSSCLCDTGYPSLLSERGVHKPSSTEKLAPFYQDPAQRIATLAMSDLLHYFVFPVEALVELAEGREGSEIEWDEWKKHVFIPSIHKRDHHTIWVSGCRLFCVTCPGYGPDTIMKVYDFSKKGRVEYLGKRARSDLGGVRYLKSTGACVRLPWASTDLFGMDGGCDGAAFIVVSVLHFSLATRLNDAFHVAGQSECFRRGYRQGDVLHIWTF